jgi:hypothetical protein
MPIPDFMLNRVSNQPRLAWLGGKMHKQGNLGRKNRSGHNTEWAESLVENGSRTFAAEVAKALAVEEPTPETVLVPDVPKELTE